MTTAQEIELKMKGAAPKIEALGNQYMGMLFGLDVRQSPHAVTKRVSIKPWPTKKRRKNWTVLVEWVPAAYKMGDILVVHPALFAEMIPYATKF